MVSFRTHGGEGKAGSSNPKFRFEGSVLGRKCLLSIGEVFVSAAVWNQNFNLGVASPIVLVESSGKIGADGTVAIL